MRFFLVMNQVTKDIFLRKSRKSNIYIVIHHFAREGDGGRKREEGMKQSFSYLMNVWADGKVGWRLIKRKKRKKKKKKSARSTCVF